MKDIQDGIKVSIQDGVTEDPEREIVVRGITGIGIAIAVRKFSKPIITSVVNTHVAPNESMTCTISSIIETEVT